MRAAPAIGREQASGPEKAFCLPANREGPAPLQVWLGRGVRLWHGNKLEYYV